MIREDGLKEKEGNFQNSWGRVKLQLTYMVKIRRSRQRRYNFSTHYYNRILKSDWLPSHHSSTTVGYI